MLCSKQLAFFELWTAFSTLDTGVAVGLAAHCSVSRSEVAGQHSRKAGLWR